MPPLRRTTPEDQDATKHLSFSEREANRDANENFKLGRAAARKKDHAGAMLHYHMALKLQREILGHEHPVVATTLNAIGLVLMEAGDINGAQAALQEALYIRQEELRDVADDVAATLTNLSALQDVAFAPPSKVPKSPEFPPTRNRLVLQDAIFDQAIQDGVVEHVCHEEEGRLPSANKLALDAPLQSTLEISYFDVKDHSQSTNDDDSTIATTSTSLSSKTNHGEQIKSTAGNLESNTGIVSNGHCHPDALRRVSLFSSWFQRRDTCEAKLNCPQKNDGHGCSKAAKTE